MAKHYNFGHNSLFTEYMPLTTGKPTRWFTAPNEVIGVVTKQYMITQVRTDHHRAKSNLVLH